MLYAYESTTGEKGTVSESGLTAKIASLPQGEYILVGQASEAEWRQIKEDAWKKHPAMLHFLKQQVSMH